MNFSEQLDKFVERGAVEYAEIHHVFTKELYGNIKTDYVAGSASLKPIVLKLVEYLQELDSGKLEFDVNHSSHLLSEIEKMIGGEND